MHDLSQLIKQAALDAVENDKPMNIVYGTVVSDNPLQISIEQKLTLGEKQLILTRNVTDYTVEMTVDHYVQNNAWTDDPKDREVPFTAPHYHPYVGKKEFLVHNALQTGEKVIMLRMQRGQKFLVIDRLG